MEENFVIKEIKNGDSGSFKILYEKYQSKLFAYVYCKVSDKAEVEDNTAIADDKETSDDASAETTDDAATADADSTDAK